MILSPSILAGDFANLQKDIAMINNSAADYLHIDIMDGVFVPNISFGFSVTEAIARHIQKPLDFHLMIVEPHKYLQQCKDTGAELISVHYEVCPNLHSTIQQIKALGCKAGVAINPHTPVHLLSDIIRDIDVVLIMSVNPGFGGQKFIEHTYRKVAEAKQLIDENNSKAIIEIDGGVNLENSPKLLAAGAEMLVAGSAVFNTENPTETIKTFKQLSA